MRNARGHRRATKQQRTAESPNADIRKKRNFFHKVPYTTQVHPTNLSICRPITFPP